MFLAGSQPSLFLASVLPHGQGCPTSFAFSVTLNVPGCVLSGIPPLRITPLMLLQLPTLLPLYLLFRFPFIINSSFISKVPRPPWTPCHSCLFARKLAVAQETRPPQRVTSFLNDRYGVGQHLYFVTLWGLVNFGLMQI